MFKLAALLLSINAMANIAQSDRVCVIIDAANSYSAKNPHRACPTFDLTKCFEVYHMNEACFELGVTYDLLAFASDTSGPLAYMSRCFYHPTRKDEGKLLRLNTDDENTSCILENAITIDR